MADSFKYDVFLSHNSAEKQMVEALASRLQQDGFHPFLDKWHLVPGQPWQSGLADALNQSTSTAVFFGPSGASAWHSEEMQIALNRAVRSRDDYRVIPVLLPGGDPAQVDGFLELRTWVDFRPGLDDETAYGRLVAAVKGLAPDDGGTELSDEPRPYRGLDRFDDDQHAFFFGRDGEIRRLIERLDRDRLVVVVGASGSGKSSLSRAGLCTDLAESIQPGIRDWRRIVFVPGSDPLRQMATHLVAHLTVTERAQLAPQFIEDFSNSADGLITALSTLFPNPQSPILLLIDQFEEVFTHKPQDTARQEEWRARTESFAANLKAAFDARPHWLHIVLTLRADFVDRFVSEDFPDFRQLLEQRQFWLGGMAEDDLREAIVFPSKRRGAFFEKGLVEMILRDMRGQSAALPLLEEALQSLWERRRGPWLTIDAYEQSGGVGGALAAKAERIYANLTTEGQTLARQIFLGLIQLGEGTRDTRRRAPVSTLIAAGADPDRVQSVLDDFSSAAARLISLSSDDPKSDTAEITHEALIDHWDRLHDWVEYSRDDLRMQRRLDEAARHWDEQGRPAGALWRPPDLDILHRFVEHLGDNLTRLQLDFFEQSRQAEQHRVETERRQHATLKRRLRFAVYSAATATVLGAAAIVLGVLANQARTDAEDNAREARYSVSRTLSLLAKQTGSQYPQQGLQLSLDALAVNLDRDEAPSLDAQEALRWTLANAGGRPYTGHAAAVSVAISNDDRWVATFTGSVVQLWKDPISAADAVPIILPGAAGPARFSPLGRWLITGSNDQDGRLLWDLNLDDPASARPKVIGGGSGDKATTATIAARANAMGVVDVSPDDRWLVTGTVGRDGVSFHAWDLHAREPGTESIDLGSVGHEFSVGALTAYAVFSGDGQWLVVGAWNPVANRGQTMDPQLWRITDGDRFATEPLVLTGHQSSVSSAVFSPDSALLATSSNEYDGHTFRYDTTVRLWDLGSRTPQSDPQVLDGHTGPIEALAFSPDGRWLVSARGSGRKGFGRNRDQSSSANSSVRIWDLQADDPVSDHIVLSGIEGAVISLVVGKNSGWLSVVSGSTGKLWNFGRITGRTRARGSGDERNPMMPLVLRSTGAGWPLDIRSARASRDQRWLITGSGDFSAHVWDLSAEDPTRTPRLFKGHEGAVESVAISAGFQFAVTGSEDRTARLWSLATRAASANPIVFWGGDTTHFSSDGRWLVSDYKSAGNSSDGTLRLWDLTKNDPVALPRILRTGKPYRFLISPDSRWLVVATSASSVLVLDLVDSGKKPLELSTEKRVFAIAISDDTRWIAAGMFDGAIRLWDMRELIADPDAAPMVLPGRRDTIFSLTFSPDHRWLVSVDSEKRTLLWDLTTGAVPSAQPLDGARPLAFSPQGHWLATSAKKLVHVWDLEQSTQEGSTDLGGHEGTIKNVAFHASDRWLVTTARKSSVRLWDFDSDSPADEPIVLPVTGAPAAFSSNGRWLVTGNATDSQLWEMSSIHTQTKARELEGGLKMVSSDGQFAVTQVTPDSGPVTYRLWDFAVADPLAPMPLIVPVILETPQALRVKSVSPDGRWLVTSTRPLFTEYRIWNMHLDELQQIALRTIERDVQPREQ